MIGGQNCIGCPQYQRTQEGPTAWKHTCLAAGELTNFKGYDVSVERVTKEAQMGSDELKAHIERLRSITDSVKHYLADIQHGVERDSSAELMLIAELEQTFFSTPAQPLNHIKAQVEEETIERCISKLKQHNPPTGALSELATMARKYKEQSDD